MGISSRYKFIVNTVYYFLIVVIVYFSVKFLFGYLFPFIIGLIITAMVQKPALYISQKFKIKKGYCALALVVLEYLIIVGLITLLIFEVGNYIYSLATSDNKLLESISNFVDGFISDFDNFPDFFAEQLKKLISSLIVIVTDFAKGIVKGLPMFITSSLVTIIASCYIAKDYDRFKASLLSVISEKYKRAGNEIKHLFNNNVKNILIGYFKILIITFIELTIGFLILKRDNAVLYAALIAVLDLLPVIGTGTVLVPWAVYSMLVSNYGLGTGILILYVIIVIVRNIIEPKIIGRQIGLHPLIALITVFIGLKFFGFIGMFIAPLLTMLIYKMYDNGIFQLLFSENIE